MSLLHQVHTHTPSAVCMQSMCGTEAGQNQHWLHCKKSNFRKVLLTNVKPNLNMSLAKVLFTLLKHYLNIRYSSICSQHIQMFSQLFKLICLNKQFDIEQYCISSQHALQLENILCYLFLKCYNCFNFYWFNLCCCCCFHSVSCHVDDIFTDFKMWWSSPCLRIVCWGIVYVHLITICVIHLSISINICL